ncbi:hypothetical protein JKP88DRAFT_255989 [Tribonema minus]|uniref:Uncharacterized protein n=1 Tax=Tribonema minus TaxID=303371 RepID=A0A835Z4D6_9STRA|nr:hypothetical protein JKP88DRAFT_255989 [Tribonema minus]
MPAAAPDYNDVTRGITSTAVSESGGGFKFPLRSTDTPVATDISDETRGLKLQSVEAAMSQTTDIMQLHQIARDVQELGKDVPVELLRCATMAVVAETRYHASMDTLAHIDGTDMQNVIENEDNILEIVETYKNGAPTCGEGTCTAGPTTTPPQAVAAPFCIWTRRWRARRSLLQVESG